MHLLLVVSLGTRRKSFEHVAVAVTGTIGALTIRIGLGYSTLDIQQGAFKVVWINLGP